MKKSMIMILLVVLIGSLAVPGLASDVGGRPYQPRPGRYMLGESVGDYVILDYANTSGIKFTVVWTGIWSMQNVTAVFDNYNYHFTHYDGDTVIEGDVMIDGVVFMMTLTRVSSGGDLRSVLISEGYWDTEYFYDDWDRYSSGYFEQYGYYTGNGYWLYDPSMTFYEGNAEYTDGNDGAAQEYYALATQKLATRTGPGTQYSEPGTFNVKGQWIRILAKAYDSGGVLWVKCEIPTRNGTIVAWTGWKRFDHSTLDIHLVPEEYW